VKGLDNEDAKSRAHTVDRQGVWKDGWGCSCRHGRGAYVLNSNKSQISD